MKQWLTNLKVLLLVPVALLMVNCSGKSSSNNANNYYMSNGTCWARNTGQQVNPSYCNGLTSNQYYMVNGQCISSINGQPVPVNYCQNGGVGGMSQCYGLYYRYNGYWEAVQCNGMNCSGQTLYGGSQHNYGQQVYCQ